MQKVLIVDDQTLNQTLLEAYIQQYVKQYNTGPIEIKKADHGLEAVKMCQEEPYDLIFMDILMPHMNGIEATKHIHALLPQSIIVIVSTEGDEENQIQALRNGAKDYFVKPIQPDIFKRRLHLYATMVDNSKGITSSKQSLNLFTNSIFCYKTTYHIENEEDLAQLWESLLFKVKDNVRTNFMSDLIRFIYQLSQVMLTRKVQPHIVIEENEHYYFFSILNINIVQSKKVMQLIENYFDQIDYLLKLNILSFKVTKDFLPTTLITTIVTPEEQPHPSDSMATTYEKGAQVLQRFDFMEEEDMTSLELKLGELSTQFMWMGSNELNSDDVDQIIVSFERISSILLFYSQTQTLGTAIRDLTAIIKKDETIFIAMAAQMSTLCKSFNNDLIVWFKTLFYEGAPSVDYMDASILSNIQMIHSFLEPMDEAAMDGDDTFEFF